MPDNQNIELKRTVKQLFDNGFRAPLTWEKANSWLKQFAEGSEKRLALLILRHMIFRTSLQMESLLNQALRLCCMHHLAGTDAAKSSHWKSALRSNSGGLDFTFGLPRGEFDPPGKSGEVIARMLKASLNMGQGKFEYPENMLNFKSVDRYLICDDGLFTATAVANMLEKFVAVDRYPDQISIVVGIAHDKGLSLLKTHFPKLTVFFGERVDSEMGLVHLSRLWIDDESWSDTEISPLAQYYKIVESKGLFKKPSALGYGDLGLLVAYEHGAPDNALQLLWDESPSWAPLIAR
jgi:hypothetical protein